jgi:SAM-dependent methyltransferase
MAASRMADFWDARARDNAWFYVDDRLDYDAPDLERFWREGEETVDVVLDRVGARIEPSDVVVEIGCGVGRLTRTLAARAREVVALDVSAEMLELAERHNPGLDAVRWLRGDGTSLAGIADASADVCFSHVVFQHIPDPAVTLGYVREMGRVLRPGGWSAFQVSNEPRVHRRRRLRRGPSAPGQGEPEWLGSAVDLAELRAAADQGGMDVERVTGEGTQFCLVLLRRRETQPAAGMR